MVKRSFTLISLLVAIGCGESAPPTGSQPAAITPFSSDATPNSLSSRRSLGVVAAIGAIQAVDPSTLTVTGSISFNDFGNASINHDGVVARSGASFAERYAGQIRSTSGDFDVLAGSPSRPLMLQVGAPNQNLNTVYDGASNATVIDGLGPLGFPSASAIGEGAIAVLFNEDQVELGLSINGANGGTATASFFRRDGSLIETMLIQLASLAAPQLFAFRRADGLRDIAGLSIHNDDLGGIGYPSFRLAQPGGVTKLVPAGAAATVTVTENGKAVAGIDIPAGTFAEDVAVSVRFTQLVGGARCHDYLLDQTGRCLEITAKTAAGATPPLQMPVVVGLCLPANPPPLDLFKFKDRTARPVALKRVDAPFLDCLGFQVASAAPSNWLEGLAMGFAKQVGALITVKSLYAAHSGFGGLIPLGDGLSSFTWASPMPIANAGLVANVLNSGKDAWAVRGTFKLLQPKNFDPFAGEVGFDAAVHPVTVGFGSSVFTIPVNSFRYVAALQRWVYAARTSSGITAMEINPVDGTFTVGATVPTAGSLPAYRAFSVQIGHRAQGVGLRCEATRICVAQEP